MGNVSYSAHISNGKSAITSKSKLLRVAKHNLRKYKSLEYSSDNILLLRGTEDLYQDVKNVYHQEFDEAVQQYNQKQKRADRRIEDYFEHVANLDQDMAVEIIFQCGDKKFWEEHTDKKEKMYNVYAYLLSTMERLIPNFKVANAVIHFDEASPHMHVVGVPVWEGAKKGLAKKVSKRNVFTPESLSVILQDKLSEEAGSCFKFNVKEELAEKKQGRNHDLSVMEYKVQQEEIRYDELKEQAEAKHQEKELLEREKAQLVQACDTLSVRVAVKQKDCEEADERVKVANESADRIEAYIKTQNDTLLDLEEKTAKQERRAEIAEQVYEMACGSGGNEALREKLIDVMCENEQLKDENSKLKQLLEKAYDFMKQFMKDGRSLLDWFMESVGQAVEKVRDGFGR